MRQAVTPGPNAVQLNLIKEIAALLDQAAVRFWPRGGWALDFQLDRLTRQHADIDLVTWLRHRKRVRRLLADQGFSEESATG
jgi:hypothetical protein